MLIQFMIVLNFESLSQNITNFLLNFGGDISLVISIAIILFVFWMLLVEKYNEKWRMPLALFLILLD